MNQYLLGLATLPALALVGVLVYLIGYALSPTGTYRVEACQHCTTLGWKDPAYYQDDHDHVSRLSWWVRTRYHRWYLARRHAHRVLWQAWADHWKSPSVREHWNKSRRKYGIR
jgi:hypothetical protein